MPLAPRLAAILDGGDRPRDAAEASDLAGLCLDTDRPADAARLFGGALDADPGPSEPRVPDPRRYNAACAAALAGTGRGRDAPPDDSARSELRRQALTYLRQERAARARQLDRDDPAAAKQVRDALIGWIEGYDLMSVRGPEGLATLPEAERAEWRSFWDDVDALLQRAAKARR
jgi:hypothetical protein